MTKRRWDRPKYRTAGRETESITGGDFSSLLARRPHRLPQISKAELRRQGEIAVQEWRRRQAQDNSGDDGT